MVDIEPGLNWKGYNLQGQNGFDVNLVSAISFTDIFSVGIGAGYLNFEGINGLSVFGDVAYLPFRNTLVTPLINLKVGYSHIWNQYPTGTGTPLVEFSGGVAYRVTEKWSVFLKSGVLMAQQSFFVPIKIGVMF